MNFEYPCRIEPGEEHGYIAQFIDVEEAFTCGETIEECLHNAEEILTTMLSIRLENDDEIPRPTAGRHKYKIAPAAAVQAALLVKFSRQGKPLADLARTLGVTWPVVQRLENPNHSPTLKQLERAAAALGKRLIISFE